MRGRVDLFEHTDGDLGIDLGGVQADMAQQLLDKADVGPVFQHHGGHGVPEQMAGSLFADVGGVHVVANKLGQTVFGERFGVGGQKQRAVVRVDDQLGPGVFKVFGDPGQRPLAHGHHAVLFALALADDDGAPVGVDIVQLEVTV